MRLTLLVLAIDAEKELSRILPELRDIGDELVVGIDDTTTDGTLDVARRFTDRIYPVPHEGFRGQGRPGDLNAVECILPYCRGDWVLRVDQDETLSSLWHDKSYVSALLEDRVATQYWIPRRLVVPPGDRYICSGRWFPAYQLRLYRNIASLIEFNRRPHSVPRIAGEQRFLSDSWIYHWDPVWYDRARRQQKVAFYYAIGYTSEECYLHDDRVFATRPLDFEYPRVSPSTVAAPVEDHRFCAALELLDYADRMPAGTVQPIYLAIKNCSNRTFSPSSPCVRPATVSLSYHWYTEVLDTCRWENERHDLPRPLAPGECASRFLRIDTPEKPGRYFLQPDLVEEQVAWFSWHCPLPTRPVRIF